MALAKKGDRVRIDYTGTIADGTVFDSTIEDDNCEQDDCDSDECATGDCGCGCESGPMELTIGSGEFFPRIEEALIGMSPGDKKTVVVVAEDAFGEYDEGKVFTVPKSDLPEDLKPDVGDELVLSDEDDESLGVVVTAVSDEGITFDANHPLAGEDLTFELQLVEIM